MAPNYDVQTREAMQKAASGVELILERVSALDDRVELKFKNLEKRIDEKAEADKELRRIMEENRDKRCAMHESDISQLKKDKEELQKQRWTTAGVVAVIMVLITLVGPKIIEAIVK